MSKAQGEIAELKVRQVEALSLQEASQAKLAIRDRQLEQSAEALKSEQITRAGLEEEILRTRTEWHNREADVVALKNGQDELESEVRFVQQKRAEAVADRDRLTAKIEQLHAGMQQPPQAADDPTTIPVSPDQSTTCTRCAEVSAKLANLNLLYDEVENNADLYKERFLQMQKWEQGLVRSGTKPRRNYGEQRRREVLQSGHIESTRADGGAR